MENPIILISGDYSARILPFGAELCSLKHVPSDTEFIWQADKSIWPRHAPVLFPFVGRLKNFKYVHLGQSYTIEQHGFARDSLFSLVEHTHDRAVFELSNNTYTQSRYPFQFSFKVSYVLQNHLLEMNFEIANKGNGIMPVSFGGHPAFAIDDPNDAIIEFDNDNDPQSWLLDGNFISNKLRAVTNGHGKIEINDQSFLNDAMVFKNLESYWITLSSKTNNRHVKVEIKDWPYLGIWSKPKAKFICIEPWHGLADAVDFGGEVSQKEGIILLSANQRVEKAIKIEVNV